MYAKKKLSKNMVDDCKRDVCVSNPFLDNSFK